MSSSRPASSPLTIPFVSVVFPAPSSPESRINTGALSCAPRFLPWRIVSSAEDEINCQLPTLDLAAQSRQGAGNGANDIRGHERSFAGLCCGEVPCQAVQIHSIAQRKRPGIGDERAR